MIHVKKGQVMPGLIVMCVAVFLSGCTAIASRVGSGLADNLTQAILSHDDPKTVADGAPAYLLLVDSFVQDEDSSAPLLQAAAQLYAAYAAVFVEDVDRAKRLSARARVYGERALCQKHHPDPTLVVMNIGECGWSGLPHDALVAEVENIRIKDVPALYAFTISWLVWIRAHSDDFVALADLPKVEVTLNRVRGLDDDYEAANVQLYLGVLNTLRPPALGGKPELGRSHFEEAIKLSNGRDLSAKVEYARGYARLVYDRELHDRLLQEVLSSEIDYPGYTLLNALAQRQARELMATADDYF